MKQEKIAISIDPILLGEVEGTIDGVLIRNRSQAIEALLRKAIGRGVSTAVILAGGPHGEGKAMRAYAGKPVMQHIIEWMSRHGIRRFIVAIDENERKIRSHFEDGSRLGVRMFYLLESVPAGTAGAIFGCRSLLDAPFVVANCDSIFSFNLSGMFSYHAKSGKLVTMAVKESITTSKYGTVDMEGGEIRGFYEKSKQVTTNMINTGLYVMSPEVFAHLPETGTLEHNVFPKLAAQGLLGGYVFTSEWKDLERLE